MYVFDTSQGFLRFLQHLEKNVLNALELVLSTFTRNRVAQGRYLSAITDLITLQDFDAYFDITDQKQIESIRPLWVNRLSKIPEYVESLKRKISYGVFETSRHGDLISFAEEFTGFYSQQNENDKRKNNQHRFHGI